MDYAVPIRKATRVAPVDRYERSRRRGGREPIDYLHPFLNQMLDYENKGPVRNELARGGKGFLGIGRVSSRFMLIVDREDTLRRVL